MTQREQLVRERAYDIWEGEGRIFGRADAHWLQAETELRASLSPAPMLVQASMPALTLSPSPAQVLGETLKAKPGRTRSVTATVEAKVKTAARASAGKAPTQVEAAPKPAMAAKSAATKKTAADKPAGVKAASAAKAGTTKAAARPRVAEAVATVH